MITKMISSTEYEIKVFDFIDLADDYICGYARVDNKADNDLSCWHFYPVSLKPLSAGNLKKISSFIAKLNS